MATTVAMPSSRQRDDVYEAFNRLSASCDNFDRDAAISACKDGIRASKVILALLGGSDPDASSASSSEESGGPVDPSDSEDSDGEPGSPHSADVNGGDSSDDDDDDDDDDDGGAAGDYDPGSSDDEDDVSCSDSTSGDEDTSSDELVADYAGLTDASRHCDRCHVWGHTNQYCPDLPARKRRRL